MLPRTRVLLVLVLGLALFGLATPVWAVYPPPIKDEGKFFSAEALEKANKQIKEIYNHSKKDLVIETFSAVPEGKKVPEEKNKKEEFFAEWAESRARELGVNGVYVLICKSPRYLFIEADRRTREKEFTARDRERVQEKFFANFREKKFDEGLKEAIDVVESALKANAK